MCEELRASSDLWGKVRVALVPPSRVYTENPAKRAREPGRPRQQRTWLIADNGCRESAPNAPLAPPVVAFNTVLLLRWVSLICQLNMEKGERWTKTQIDKSGRGQRTKLGKQTTHETHTHKERAGSSGAREKRCRKLLPPLH